MDKKLHEKALEFWREREMTYPPRVRRMNPDAIDMASGAWDRCLAAVALREKANDA